MVDEAVLIIQYLWKMDAQYKAAKINKGDNFEVEAYSAFMISPELKLFSETGYYETNPATNKCCFFDIYQFNNSEEVDKYINDVLKRLPDGTVYNFANVKHHFDELYTMYNFKLKIRMK